MSRYVRANGSTVIQYPYSLKNLKIDFPRISFTRNPGPSELEPLGIFEVTVLSPPTVNPITHIVEKDSSPKLVSGNWVHGYTPRLRTPEEQAQFLSLHKRKIQTKITDQVQDRLDNFAKTRNYHSMMSACTYATSTVTKFKTEGQYCVQARDATWAALYQVLAEVEAGTRALPTDITDVEDVLPVLAWPT